MLLEIRHATGEDLPRARQFYADRQYGGGIQPQDTVLLAEREDELVGIVRLASEQGTTVLRGMQVHPAFQHQGIGAQMLAAVAEELESRPCFCIPYAHLVDFYARIGFHVVEPGQAPTFLRERLEGYRTRGDGREYLLMRRAGTAAESRANVERNSIRMSPGA
ncbi:MAG: GNAT family N-acetyltransferase [Gemmatimonadetes bacterium]|jgi:GNAT superfamily N-acetyltransferase|nr:GNAT family N-acetyltransferase [Gemmatimonadota bacterium]